MLALNMNMIKFSALKHVPAHVRGGGIDHTLLQLETKWIHNLNATRYPGLNEYISFKSFLKPTLLLYLSHSATFVTIRVSHS